MSKIFKSSIFNFIAGTILLGIACSPIFLEMTAFPFGFPLFIGGLLIGAYFISRIIDKIIDNDDNDNKNISDKI